MAGCSSDSAEEADAEAEKKETEENAETEDEKDAVPEDDELFKVIEKNVQTMADKDIDSHMETITSDESAQAGTKELMEQMEAYDLDIEVANLKVEEKDEKEAQVSYTQKTVKKEGPDYQNTEVDGVHTLKLDEDGEWKIFDTEINEQRALDENGEIIENSDMDDEEIEGQYVEELQALDLPINEEEWEFLGYDEDVGTGFAYFAEDGDLANQLGVHVVKNSADELEAFIELTEQNLEDIISTGDIEFKTKDMTDEEGFYEFKVTDDEVEEDQHEIGRAFVSDGDIYLVRYTSIGEEIDDKEKWIEKLKQVK